jgi:hypothetical protein
MWLILIKNLEYKVTDLLSKEVLVSNKTKYSARE